MQQKTENAWQALLFCRSGFEPECGQEAVDKVGREGFAAHYQGAKDSGLVRLGFFPAQSAGAALQKLRLDDLIFARQLLALHVTVDSLPKKDRVGPLLAAATDIRHREVGAGDNAKVEPWSCLEVYAKPGEPNEDLQRFVRKLSSPLATALRHAGLLSALRSDSNPLVVIFESFEQAILATLNPQNRAVTTDGIPRLKMPAEAPSRSTLKLEEAWHVFVGQERWYELLGDGKQAVDLGAAPGGWTWQLVRQGMDVTAIDNADMDVTLMQSGQVTHIRTDGFTFRPPAPVHWMVCDMVEQPMRVMDLVTLWLADGWCRYTIFNLKLPMKTRYQEVQRCLALLHGRLADAGLQYRLMARQLYHDREEITCFVELLSGR